LFLGKRSSSQYLGELFLGKRSSSQYLGELFLGKKSSSESVLQYSSSLISNHLEFSYFKICPGFVFPI
jgi:hypothetical protein